MQKIVTDYHLTTDEDSKLLSENNPIINVNEMLDIKAGLETFDRQQKTTLTSRGSSMSASSRIGEKRNSHVV